MATTDMLLCVPLKKSSEVDIMKPLKNTIASLYSSADNPEDLSGSIGELSYMRSQALSKTLDKSPAALELLYRYYDQLSLLETKIPAQEVQIAFKWKDAFDKGSLFGGRVSLSVSSLGYEKVCVLFNIAALQSQIGAHTRIGESDEDMKGAAKMFQLASGIFAHLKMAPTTMGGQEPTPDLTGDTLSALSALMLAQAQEIFAKKAIADKMKDATVARLCIQCEDMYADALKQLQRDTVKHNWEKDWIPTVAAKQAAFSALTQYFQSQVCADKKLVGEQITRLTQSLEILKQAQQRSGNPSFFADYVNKATRLLQQAKKDNDFIYHERVPEASTLPPVDKVASARIAKVLPVPERMLEKEAHRDLFANLVPVQVHQAIATCEVRKSEMTGVKINQLREATSLLNTVLASLNLPAALEDTRGGTDDVPQSLKEKARLVHEMGGSTELFKSVQEIPELVQRNKEILDEAERLLREEEESDNQLRAQLKEKWTRTPSEKLNATFKTNAARYREIINNALAADEVVRGKLATHEQAIQMLSRGEHGLADVVPKSSATKSATGSESAKQNLKRLMGEVEELKRERETLEGQYKDTAFDMKTPFLKALAQDGAINEPVMSVELLDKALGPLDGKTTSNLEQQERVIVGIQQNSEEYFGKKAEGSDTLSSRDQIMRQLAEGYDAYTDLQNNIKEGRKFYNDLTQLLVAFQNKISDFCFARKTEKEELLKDVTRDASSGLSGGPNSAPPRPPPPTVSSAPPTSAAPPYNPGAHALNQTPYNPGAPPAYPGAPPTAVGAAGGALPYPPSYQQNMHMPMPYQQQNMAPYPFTPMPATFNPYATFPLPSHYNVPYPQQQMGYNPYGYPPPNQQQQPPPQ